MKAKLERVSKESTGGTIHSFWFEPEKPLDHIAGQFLEMTIDNPSPDDRGIRRWFTISSAPSSSPLFSITTKLSSPGSTFKDSLQSLKKGDSVSVSDPMGDFVLPMDSSIPLVFVAGGIGITPFHSIIGWLNDSKLSRDITLIYAARQQSELVFLPLFESYGLERIIVLSEPTGSWDGETGQLNGQRIVDLALPAEDALIYVSGPERMVETLHSELSALGIDKSRLVGDFFPGYNGI